MVRAVLSCGGVWRVLAPGFLLLCTHACLLLLLEFSQESIEAVPSGVINTVSSHQGERFLVTGHSWEFVSIKPHLGAVKEHLRACCLLFVGVSNFFQVDSSISWELLISLHCVCINLFNTSITLWERYYDNSYFTHEETGFEKVSNGTTATAHKWWRWFPNSGTWTLTDALAALCSMADVPLTLL